MTPSEPPRHWWVAPLLAAVLALAASWPLILSGYLNGRGAADQLRYHEPAIFTFASDWPTPDLSDYLSATTPGYHLVMAYVALTPGADRAFVQLASSCFYAGLGALLAGAIARRAGPVLGLSLALPLLCSLHIYASGVWLLPDNAGWLFVLVVLLLALEPGRTWRWLLGVGLAMVALVLMRQIHLWAAAGVWAGAWLGAVPLPAGRGPAGQVRALFDHAGTRFKQTVPAVLATVPAFVAVGAFAGMWGGLTPPTFQDAYHGGNPAAPAFVLTLIAVFSAPYAALLWCALADAWGGSRRRMLGWIACVGALGLVVGAAVPTTFDADAGRWTGLWNLVRALPDWSAPADRSALLVLGAGCGAIALLGWCASVPVRARWTALAAIAGFTAAQASSRELWQRYNEPFVILLLAVLAAIALHAARAPARLARLPIALLALPALVVAATFAGLTARELATARPVHREPAKLKSDLLREELEDRLDENGTDVAGAPRADAPTPPPPGRSPD